MRIVIQRTTNASVTIDNQVTAAIGKGYVILVGIEQNDTKDDANWLIHKIIGLRIFDDDRTVCPTGPKRRHWKLWSRHESGTHQRRSRHDLHG